MRIFWVVFALKSEEISPVVEISSVAKAQWAFARKPFPL
jgi:hypothetical protein